MTTQQAIDALQSNQKVYQKNESIHINCCFPNTQAAISGSTAVCKGLAKILGRSVIVNIYYQKNGKLHRMKRFFSLRNVYLNKPCHVTQKEDKNNNQR